MAITFNPIIAQGGSVLARRSMRMLVYLSCLFTCQLRDLSRNFPRRTPPQITVFFLGTVKKILITAISENSSFLAKSLANRQPAIHFVGI